MCDYSEWHLHFQAPTVLFALAFVVDLQSDQAIYFRSASEEIIWENNGLLLCFLNSIIIKTF